MGTRSALDILVKGLFDYSGMFPPESKSFSEALHASSQFERMLRRPSMVSADIVLTVEELKNLSEAVLVREGFQSDTEFKVAVLGTGVKRTAKDTMLDLETIEGVTKSFHKIKLTIGSYEIKIDPEFISNDRYMNELLCSCPYSIALEPDLSTEDWESILDVTIAYIATDAARLTLKVRGTGPTAIDNKKIAHVIQKVADAGIHLKATGGLHHPLIEESRYGNNLGFLGFATALYLAHHYKAKISKSDIESCLNGHEASHFVVGETLQFKDYVISQKELSNLKSRFRFGIGSCSLSEPDEDLSRLFD